MLGLNIYLNILKYLEMLDLLYLEKNDTEYVKVLEYKKSYKLDNIQEPGPISHIQVLTMVSVIYLGKWMTQMSHIKFMIIFGKNMELKESLMILNDHATGKI